VNLHLLGTSKQNYGRMIKGIIFDHDMTLVHTLALFDLRKRREWSKVYQRLNQTFLFEGIKPLIVELLREFKIGVVTSSPAKYAEKVISYHDLGIPLLTGYHDTRMHKPHKEPILHGVGRLGLQPNEVISVGDEVKDIISSNSAGTKTIAVTWGLDSELELENANPDSICHYIEELRTAIYSYVNY
jgi:HAD superfamily hydrolase (TIGR01549 family)